MGVACRAFVSHANGAALDGDEALAACAHSCDARPTESKP